MAANEPCSRPGHVEKRRRRADNAIYCVSCKQENDRKRNERLKLERAILKAVPNIKRS